MPGAAADRKVRLVGRLLQRLSFPDARINPRRPGERPHALHDADGNAVQANRLSFEFDTSGIGAPRRARQLNARARQLRPWAGRRRRRQGVDPSTAQT